MGNNNRSSIERERSRGRRPHSRRLSQVTSALGSTALAWFIGLPVGAVVLATFLTIGLGRTVALVAALCAVAGVAWAGYRVMRDPGP